MQVGLLEDDIAIQEMLLLVLQDEGYQVTNFSSAQECLTALGIGQHSNDPLPIDLLIIDWRLSSSMSGIEVIQTLRTDARLQSLPIILTTAASFHDLDILQTLQVTLLEKPFPVEDATQLIKRLLNANTPILE